VSTRPTTLERAFQLARSGRPITVGDIKKALRSEGYASGQIDGKALNKQLRALILSSRAALVGAMDHRTN
jgi:hypothetical protein